MKNVEPLIAAALPELVELRHALHQHPELAYEERWTAARVVEELERSPGMQIRQGVAETGVVAVLGGGKSGPCVALRADMDALPMEERADRPHCSLTPGRMHACGHDGHVTCLLGAARVLAQLADELEGPVVFVFQPAEEGGAGGRRMCQEGALEDPPVAAIFGLHGWPELQVGEIGVRSGPFLASADSFAITVHGQGAHAAFPHQGVDPILIGSHVVVALQALVARETDPLAAAVVTVAQFQAGTAGNIIPPRAELRGTLRSLDPQVRKRLWARLETIAERTAEGFGGRAEVEIVEGYPVTVNDERARGVVDEVAAGIPKEKVRVRETAPVMGAEDFAFYGEQVPAMFFYLGLRGADQPTYPKLHQPDFDFADAAIPVGVRLHVEIARRFARIWER